MTNIKRRTVKLTKPYETNTTSTRTMKDGMKQNAYLVVRVLCKLRRNEVNDGSAYLCLFNFNTFLASIISFII